MMSKVENNVIADKSVLTKSIKKRSSTKDKEQRSMLNPRKNKNFEQEKNSTFVTLEIIEYVPNSVVIKTIIKKTTGHVIVSSFDSGEALTETTSPFDTFIQVIDGKAEVIINGHSHSLDTGQSIIIPAHSVNIIKAHVRVKIISTVIKSGYDEFSI